MIPADKQAHILAGAAVFATLAPSSYIAATVCLFVAAVGKEVYDYFHKDVHTPDVWDAVATIAGGAAAGVIQYLL
jgi:hypothetical protein